MATPKTILLKGEGLYKEASAGGNITPGHLINRTSTGTFVVHATAGGNVLPMFAMENELEGEEITDAYAATERVVGVIPQRGAEVYAFIEANGAAVVIGDLLESAGNGTLQKHTAQVVNEGGAATYTAYSAPVVGRALEALDNSANGTAARIRVEIL